MKRVYYEDMKKIFRKELKNIYEYNLFDDLNLKINLLGSQKSPLKKDVLEDLISSDSEFVLIPLLDDENKKLKHKRRNGMILKELYLFIELKNYEFLSSKKINDIMSKRYIDNVSNEIFNVDYGVLTEVNYLDVLQNSMLLFSPEKNYIHQTKELFEYPGKEFLSKFLNNRFISIGFFKENF